MIIKSIKLNNIRSYLDETIDFPEGSVLLSGDIGCGKSTILLALEFALFGLTKKDLPGEALLRKGAKEGFVEAIVNINNKDYTIKRNLKKVADRVTQTAGHIIGDEIKKEGTAIELKSHILELLNYPPEMLTKKSLVYRYTVYTPQEAIKTILLEDKESRLDTLRKVFGIDKYKKIRENSSIYLKEMREKLKFYSGKVDGLEDKQKSLEEYKKKGNEMKLKMDYIRPKIEEKKKLFYKQKNVVEIVEKKLKEKFETKKTIELVESQIEMKNKQADQTKPEIEKINSEIKLLNEEDERIVLKESAELNESIIKSKSSISEMENSNSELIREISSAEAKKELYEKEVKSFMELDNCPTCKQEVEHSHKEEITKEKRESLDHLGKLISAHKSNKEQLEKNLLEEKTNFEKLNKEYQEIALIKNKKENIRSKIREKEARIATIKNLEREIVEEIQLLKDKKKTQEVKLEELESFQEEHIQKEKMQLEHLQKDLHDMDLDLARKEKEYEALVKQTSELIVEINNMLTIQDKIKRIKSLSNWFGDFFVPLMSNMEKQVLLQVYNEFNLIFKEWLSILLPETNVEISLNEEFTPVIIQNGHEISLEHMSGGEKTAISLTYRLALNKVINDLLSNIHTRDIIILDEPTDGFSTEQLDKVRDVLDELNLKQIIIVSHESKIESFVDNCIRIEKLEHVSKANSQIL